MSFPSLLTVLLLSANDPVSTEGTATIPIRDLLALQAVPGAVGPARPPVDALVTRTSLKGRVGEDALLVDAHFEVEVLASDLWSRVELLELGTDAWVVEVSQPNGATVASSGDRLVLVSNQAGRYQIDAKVSVRANGAAAARRAQLKLGAHVAPVPLNLEVDGTVFAVRDRVVLPKGRLLEAGWREIAPVVQKQEVVRPPVEPRIPTAEATWVTTLEGNLTLRVHYALRLDRSQTLAFELPVDHTLTRAVVNGAPQSVKVSGGKVELEVSPARLGDTEAMVELVLTRALGTFHLSGQVGLALPRVSWPVDELHARAHLPAVFNYQRVGGSLEPDPTEASPTASARPLPGKELRFRQLLVGGSAPSLQLAYSVDISQSYFR